MPVSDFLVIFLTCTALMLLCRVVPLVALKGRSLSPTVARALEFIPPAAFTALVANDLFQPASLATLANGTWTALVPLAAAAVVGVIGVKTKSMAWCIVAGVAAYAGFSALLG